MLHLWSERPLSPSSRMWLQILWMIEQPHRIPTRIAGDSGNLVKQGSFLCKGSLLVARHHLSKQFTPGGKTQRRFHLSSLKNQGHTRPCLPHRISASVVRTKKAF